MSRLPAEGYALRKPRPIDYTELATWIDDADAARRWTGLNLSWPLEGPALAEAICRTDSTQWAVIDAKNRLAAFGEHYSRRSGWLRLARLIIDPDRRGQHLVDVLIDKLITRACQDWWFHTVELGVYQDNANAIRAYQRLGFIDFIDPQPSDDVISMKRVIDRRNNICDTRF